MSRKTRKLIWSAPLVAVFAVIGTLAAIGALGIGGVSANELPNGPQNLKVTAANEDTGRTTLVLNWEAPASGAPDMYRIDVSTNNLKYKLLTEVPGTTNTYPHVVRPRGMDRDDPDGRLRYYRVYAKNSHGYGVVSSAESATTKDLEVPGEAEQVTGSSSDPEVINLSWSVPDDGGSDILGYCIRAWPTGTSAADVAAGDTGALETVSNLTCLSKFQDEGTGGNAGDYRDETDATMNNEIGGVIRILPTTAYAHKNLRAKQEWTYEVYAFNRFGSSETASSERSVQSAAASRPSAPGSLLGLQSAPEIADLNSRQIDLYWTAPDDGGQNVTAYEIEVSDTRGHWPSEGARDLYTGGVPTIAGVNIKRASGTDNSNGRLFADPAEPSIPRANVAVFKVSAASQTDVLDGTDPDSQPVPYQVQYTYTGSDHDGDSSEDSPSALEFRTTLYFRVRTVTGADSSEMTSTAIAEIVSDLRADNPDGPDDNELRDDFAPDLSAPEIKADGIGTGRLSEREATEANPVIDDETREDEPADDDLTTGQIKLTIAKAVPGTSEYRVDVSDDNGKTWSTTHESTLPVNTNEYEHVGLKPEEGLRFRLFGKKGSDTGLASNVVLDYAGNSDMPGKVGMLQAAADGAGKIDLSWKAPANDGGADVEQYCIVVNEVDADADDAPLAGEAKTRADIMTTGTGVNCSRRGEPDAMPIKVTLQTHIFQVDSGTTMVTFSGLEEETRWQFEVYALNKASDTDVNNDGIPAADDGNAPGADLENGGRHAVSRTSDKAKATTGEAVMPAAPQRLSAQSARDVSDISGETGQGVVLLWNPPSDPAGAPVLSYKIELKVDDGEFEVEVETHPAATTHWVDTDELVDEMRTYRISATNVVGTGTAMATVMIPYPPTHTTHTTPTTTPAVDALTAPSITTATPGTGTITVEWTPGDNADGHLAMLFTDDFVADPVVATKTATDTMHTFPNVANGGYVVVVVSFTSSFDFEFVFTSVSVPAN